MFLISRPWAVAEQWSCLAYVPIGLVFIALAPGHMLSVPGQEVWIVFGLYSLALGILGLRTLRGMVARVSDDGGALVLGEGVKATRVP